MDETTKMQSQKDAAASQSQEQQTNQDSSEQGLEQLSIPEKFVGKGAEDIIKSYEALEKQFSSVSSERAEERRKREELEARVREVEARYSQAQSTQSESDPLSEYEEQFETNPKEAIKNLALAQAERARMTSERQAADDFYRRQKETNPEFGQLENEMTNVAREYGHLLDPKKVNSPKTIELAYLIAQARTRDSYAKSYAEKLQAEKSKLVDEKRSASVSESGSGIGTSGSSDPWNMPLADLAKKIGRVD
jgi:hypothetical protein